jgi:hypothetical protein
VVSAAARRLHSRPSSRSQFSARIVTLARQSVVCAGDQASQSNIRPPPFLLPGLDGVEVSLDLGRTDEAARSAAWTG